MTRPYCIGVTGGIGSGKTTVTDIFSEYNVPVIDADAISHEVVQAGQPALQEIATAFGSDLIGADGELRRSQLRKLIFDDFSARKKLESIIHPQVYKEIAMRVSQISSPYYIISSPLLIESRLRHDLDRILVIDAAESAQIERASRRDNSKKEDIIKIVNSQISRADRLDAADDVIVNDKDLNSLRKQVETLHLKYLDLAAQGMSQCS